MFKILKRLKSRINAQCARLQSLKEIFCARQRPFPSTKQYVLNMSNCIEVILEEQQICISCRCWEGKMILVGASGFCWFSLLNCSFKIGISIPLVVCRSLLVTFIQPVQLLGASFMGPRPRTEDPLVVGQPPSSKTSETTTTAPKYYCWIWSYLVHVSKQ